MKRLAVIAILLVLLYGCTSFLGFVFEEDCEGMRDAEAMACLHQAAMSMAHLTQDADEGAEVCNRILDE
ncbi:TPA: hypothetical protein EYP38_04170, partial [Candidatus Micrarchaeota archaeon]|nr:hypothetical protein [Candidatus Micrarchaeota archaeon]